MVSGIFATGFATVQVGVATLGIHKFVPNVFDIVLV